MGEDIGCDNYSVYYPRNSHFENFYTALFKTSPIIYKLTQWFVLYLFRKYLSQTYVLPEVAMEFTWNYPQVTWNDWLHLPCLFPFLNKNHLFFVSWNSLAMCLVVTDAAHWDKKILFTWHFFYVFVVSFLCCYAMIHNYSNYYGFTLFFFNPSSISVLIVMKKKHFYAVDGALLLFFHNC